jgi:hypothetical protein
LKKAFGRLGEQVVVKINEVNTRKRLARKSRRPKKIKRVTKTKAKAKQKREKRAKDCEMSW